MKHQKTILSTDNLSIGYASGDQRNVVLEHLDITIRSSALTCFMGPNGVGKSTLLRTLCGSQKPLYGQVLINNQPIESLSKSELALKVAVVLTDTINAGAMTVRELVAMGRYPYQGWVLSKSHNDNEAIEKAIEQTGTLEIAFNKIAELSDGQRQKALIARALCQDTSVIILDEPTAHLDLNNRVEVINLLKELARESGKAILMATHELDLALQAADEIWVVGFDGNLIRGFPEDLVLSGKIDQVFNLKGFDLKTGYLEKKISKASIAIIGEGYPYLWTKNALERNGFGVVSTSDQSITIHKHGNEITWTNEKGVKFDSLEYVISSLNKG